MASYMMTDAEQLPVGFVVKDKGGEKILTLAELPTGSTCTIVSSDEQVVSVTMRPDGLSAVLASVHQGNAQLHSEIHIPAGTDFPAIDTISDDTIQVSVSAPGTAEFGVGAPEPEGVVAPVGEATAARAGTLTPQRRAQPGTSGGGDAQTQLIRNREVDARQKFDNRTPAPTASERSAEDARRANWQRANPGVAV